MIKFQKCILLIKMDDIDGGIKIRDELKEFLEEKLDKNDIIYRRYLEIKGL